MTCGEVAVRGTDGMAVGRCLVGMAAGMQVLGGLAARAAVVTVARGRVWEIAAQVCGGAGE
ncbi:hypothetical protein SAMN04487818_106346 [Actinokineospora terrae]|uniref:Uncharacterized protein n=1 Tax=Actinokineospora terrae TaxID=155974 RepID=A0A1H9TLE7_9PSEU|nr:hypothetical protein SAMN04487818_106346 [Actinokineospora terrae]